MRSFGPLLLTPRMARLALLFAVPVVVVLVVGDAPMDLADLREMAHAPEGAPIARRIMMRRATMLGTIVGFLAGSAGFEAQRMSVSWGLPLLRTGLLHGHVALATLTALLGVAWDAAWAPVTDAVRSGLVGVTYYGIMASWGHLPALLRSVRWSMAVPIALFGVMLFAPDWLVAMATVLDVPGLLVLAGASVGLMWWGTTREAHRLVLSWTPTVDDAARPSRADDLDGGKDLRAADHDTWSWLRRLADEWPSSHWARRLLPFPQAAWLAGTSALFVVVSHFSGSHGALVALVIAQAPMAAGHPLPYPLSRRDRARLQFAHQAVTLLIVMGVALPIALMLHAADVPPIAWFSDGAPPRQPLVVGYASMFALIPVAQAGIAWQPVGPWPLTSIRSYVTRFVPFILFAVLEAGLARGLWTASGQQRDVTVLWCLLLGGVLQGVNYAYLRAVFARRDLTPVRA